MNQLVENVVNWAAERNLLKEENRSRQFMKVVEEVGEVAEGLAKNNEEMLKDGIGDVVVTLVILAEPIRGCIR